MRDPWKPLLAGIFGAIFIYKLYRDRTVMKAHIKELKRDGARDALLDDAKHETLTDTCKSVHAEIEQRMSSLEIWSKSSETVSASNRSVIALKFLLTEIRLNYLNTPTNSPTLLSATTDAQIPEIDEEHQRTLSRNQNDLTLEVDDFDEYMHTEIEVQEHNTEVLAEQNALLYDYFADHKSVLDSHQADTALLKDELKRLRCCQYDILTVPLWKRVRAQSLPTILPSTSLI